MWRVERDCVEPGRSASSSEDRRDSRPPIRVGQADVGCPVEQDTMFHFASMTKAVTSVALMQLAEQHVVTLDDPAGELVPYLRDVQVVTGFRDDGTALVRGQARSITIRHLLTHSAGFAGAAGGGLFLLVGLAARRGRREFFDAVVVEPGRVATDDVTHGNGIGRRCPCRRLVCHVRRRYSRGVTRRVDSALPSVA